MRAIAQAGPAVKTAPVTTASASAKSRTTGDGAASTGTNVAPGNASASSARVPAVATSRPPIPPASASRMPSVSDWRISRMAGAPSATRIAAWPRSARASSRFARFAHATSSTSAEVTNRMASDRENSIRISATPPPAGTTGMRCFAMSDRSRSGTNACAVSHCRSAVEARADTSSGRSPGFSRPIAYSQSVPGRSTSEPAPCRAGSWPTGIQIAAGLGRTVSPKKPSAATPTIVMGRPLMTNVEPTTSGSRP